MLRFGFAVFLNLFASIDGRSWCFFNIHSTVHQKLPSPIPVPSELSILLCHIPCYVEIHLCLNISSVTFRLDVVYQPLIYSHNSSILSISYTDTHWFSTTDSTCSLSSPKFRRLMNFFCVTVIADMFSQSQYQPPIKCPLNVSQHISFVISISFHHYRNMYCSCSI